jgi:hypothetical protein
MLGSNVNSDNQDSPMNMPTRCLAEKAIAALGDPRLAEAWLNRPSPLLAGLSPLQGCTSEEQLILLERQLAWFAGAAAKSRPRAREAIDDVLNDPMIRMMLMRAGSGPQEILDMMVQRRGGHQAAA